MVTQDTNAKTVMSEKKIKDVLTSEQEHRYNTLLQSGDNQKADIYLGSHLRLKELDVALNVQLGVLTAYREKLAAEPGVLTKEESRESAALSGNVRKAFVEKADWEKYVKSVDKGKTGLERKGVFGRIYEQFANAGVIAKFFMVVLYPLVVIKELFFRGNQTSPVKANEAEIRGATLRDRETNPNSPERKLQQEVDGLGQLNSMYQVELGKMGAYMQGHKEAKANQGQSELAALLNGIGQEEADVSSEVVARKDGGKEKSTARKDSPKPVVNLDAANQNVESRAGESGKDHSLA